MGYFASVYYLNKQHRFREELVEDNLLSLYGCGWSVSLSNVVGKLVFLA